MNRIMFAGALIPAFLLAACGGGGTTGGLASAPPPVPSPAPTPTAERTPLPPTPATITGTYQPIAAFYSFEYGTSNSETAPVAPGALTIAVDASTRTYTLTYTGGPYSFEPGVLTAPANWELGYSRSDPLPYGTPQELVARGDMLTRNIPAGTGENGALRAQVSWVRLHNVGHTDGRPNYLSGAYWGQFYTENKTGLPGADNFTPTNGVAGFMVFGPRTEAGDIPASGSAQYRLESLFHTPQVDENGDTFDYTDGDTVLNVDFATKALFATYDLFRRFETYETDEEGYETTDDEGNPILLERIDMNVHASGSAQLANDGSFSLGLAGNGALQITRPDEPPVPDISRPLTGSIDGAFFGPQAAEVGGIWYLPALAPDGTPYTSADGFFGLREVR